MTTESESNEQYKRIGEEPLMWLEKAQGLRYCAIVLKDHLISLVVDDRSRPGSRRIETNGVFSSTLLLLGLAFENLIKGVDVARDPSLVNLKSIDLRLWKGDAGHAIRDFAKSLIPLDPAEEELLDRLQESIFWAGRFPIPKKSVRYYQSHNPVNKHQLSTDDFATADRLFEKLEQQLRGFRDGPK